MNANDSLKVTPWEKEANLAPTPPEKPQEKKPKTPTNQERGEATSESTDSPDLNGERPAPVQESGKRQEGEDDVDASEKADLTGKQVDDYFGDTATNGGKGQLN